MSKTVKVFLKTVIFAILALLLPLGIYTEISAVETESEANAVKPNEQGAIERMRSGFESFEERIDLSEYNISPQDLTRIFANATKNSPYLFYVDKNLSYTYRMGGNVLSVTPKYNCTQVQFEQMMNFCRGEVKKIAALANEGESELEKLIYAHDIICCGFSYDLTLESNNIYTFLTTKRGTCQGYTWAYMAVLRELGIECEYVASDSIIHIWLKVKIDGEWYYSDVTWDDPPSDEGRSMPVSRRHLLFSDRKANSDGYKDRYGASGEKCTSEKYDSFDFSEVLPPEHRHGDVNCDGKVSVFDVIYLRRYVEHGEKSEIACVICADVDGDFRISETDIQPAREIVLTNSGE